MIDFEDRTPAPPLTLGERVLGTLFALGSIYSLWCVGETIWGLL